MFHLDTAANESSCRKELDLLCRVGAGETKRSALLGIAESLFVWGKHDKT